VLEKSPFGVDKHTLQYSNEAGILQVLKMRMVVFWENVQLVGFCELCDESEDSTSNSLLWEAK
jgi:hypothetical protein